jgi:hypothetical protein
MRTSQLRRGVLVVLTLGSLALAGHQGLPVLAHDHRVAAPAASRPAEGVRGGMRIGMDELHRAGGVPPGWRFTWPEGDAARGREVFARLECYQCHEVKGEPFPAVTPDPTRRGPGLAGVGDHHPAEYFAESILNPNAVIVTGPGHTGPDGLSIMPDFRDSLTLAETIDLVAYIRSLRDGGEHVHHHAGSPPERERVVSDYRIRLAYVEAGAGHGQHPSGHQHGGSQTPGGAAAARPAAHLMVFVTDTTIGEPVPYLPVTATIHSAGAPRSVRLPPMLGDGGFHYGADVTLPPTTTKVTVTIGKPVVRVMPPVAGRFTRGAEVSFEWGK